MERIIIVAISENNVIGKDGDIPWHFPEDLKHFKEKTTGNAVIMGRKTFESLPESYRPLPDRKNIVLTRSGLEEKHEDVEEVEDLKKAYKEARKFGEKAFIIGGATVYEQTLDEVDKLVLTRIHEEYEGDTFFPKINKDKWEEETREDREKLSFIEYRRKNKE
jgi:dihydrofolate reductase